MQQDSDECFTFMLNAWKQGGMKIEIDGKNENLIDQIF